MKAAQEAITAPQGLIVGMLAALKRSDWDPGDVINAMTMYQLLPQERKPFYPMSPAKFESSILGLLNGEAAPQPPRPMAAPESQTIAQRGSLITDPEEARRIKAERDEAEVYLVDHGHPPPEDHPLFKAARYILNVHWVDNPCRGLVLYQDKQKQADNG